MAADTKDYENLKQALERTDQALVAALNERARTVRALSELRTRAPETYYAEPQDVETIDRARQLAKDFPEAGIDALFREVLGACASLVEPVRVSYLGPEGTFAQLASRKRFGSVAQLQRSNSIREVIEDVERGRSNYGVVPLETTSDGTVTETLEGLSESEVRICDELTVPANYHLLSRNTKDAGVEKVYGSPHAIAACERYLRLHFAHATVVDVPSGEVACDLASKSEGTAAVVTEAVADVADLPVLHQRVEDASGVETRFAVLSTDLPSKTGSDRTVFAMALKDSPGALFEGLKPFAERSINLTRLESRPTKAGSWKYLFYVEFDGHVTDRAILTAMEELRAISRHLKVLGSYPRPR